ncbi:M20/M25/M40 family metallo-hydrolase [Olivibacter sitiensis]|uniref:M20/M25/M40 family metallo-hydrolase n=1 Tax=Olivibacter sitiensis TaxID=376470 RepID=UPI00040B284E|nr:M20/M25/M40 family metallo-hydrolase [Olivibacter sitiensis]
MRNILLFTISLIFLSACSAHRAALQSSVQPADVNRIISTLAADDMEGRAIFSPGIQKAADFIASEFKSARLSFLSNDTSFLQTFGVCRTTLTSLEVQINGEDIAEGRLVMSSTKPGINWNDNPEINIIAVNAGEDLLATYRKLSQSENDYLIKVDESLAEQFKRLRSYLSRPKLEPEGKGKSSPTLAFVLGGEDIKSFRVNFSQGQEELPLFNVVGVLPGKSKPNEFIVFSAHYDHLGIVKPVGQDSIANGADDDASGVTAVISLAKAYAKQKNNERSLIFAAFTAEESGGFGSQYFSKQLDPDSVIAMVNIEMIGKDSKFGPNTVYITGFERSNLGTLMQKRVEGTGFSFHADPYPEQNLFYRSDNATLAAQGVPAHSFSTVQIDKDEYYHTVKDELETLDINNIISTIRAIELGARGLINGEDTPTRIPKLENGRNR